MSVPLEALDSVLFRVPRLGEGWSEGAYWAAAVIDDTDSDASISLTATGPRRLGDYHLVGSFRREDEGAQTVALPGLTVRLPMPTPFTPCVVCGTKREHMAFIATDGHGLAVVGLQCMRRAGLLPSGMTNSQFFHEVTSDPRDFLRSTVERVVSSPHFDPLNVLAAAISVHRAFGYVSKRRSQASGHIPSAERVTTLLEQCAAAESVDAISQHLLTAAVMRAEILGGALDSSGALAEKARVVLGRDSVPASSVPLLAAVPQIYARQSEPPLEPWANEYAGLVGDRVSLQCRVHSVDLVADSFDEQRRVLTFRDGDGRCLVWFTASPISCLPGDLISLRGTIKSHRTFRDIAQTILTRCLVQPTH